MKTPPTPPPLPKLAVDNTFIKQEKREKNVSLENEIPEEESLPSKLLQELTNGVKLKKTNLMTPRNTNVKKIKKIDSHGIGMLLRNRLMKLRGEENEVDIVGDEIY
ncbi:hypothetical protein HDU92_008916 [Lobulomyces angularis]|nr:hypothetical protein HDU92_008916 [Lobulomyces angularis]